MRITSFLLLKYNYASQGDFFYKNTKIITEIVNYKIVEKY